MSIDHTRSRKEFLSIEADLDDAADELARRKGIPTLQLPESLSGLAQPIDAGGAAPSARQEAIMPRQQGRVAASPEKVPPTEYSHVKCRCPDYLVDQLYLEARRKRVTVNHLILSALKAQGFFIRDDDMIPDGRRLRGSRTRA